MNLPLAKIELGSVLNTFGYRFSFSGLKMRLADLSLFTETWKGFVDFCKKAEPQNRHFDTCERKERVVK